MPIRTLNDIKVSAVNKLLKLLNNKIDKTGGTFTGLVTSNHGAEAIALKPGSENHVYLTFYADSSSPEVRTAFVGFPSAHENSNLTIRNEAINGNIKIMTQNNVFISAGCLDVNGNRNFGCVTSDPEGGKLGDECFNTTEKRKKFHDGTKWVDPMKYV